jgi:hypothetical protein
LKCISISKSNYQKEERKKKERKKKNWLYFLLWQKQKHSYGSTSWALVILKTTSPVKLTGDSLAKSHTPSEGKATVYKTPSWRSDGWTNGSW